MAPRAGLEPIAMFLCAFICVFVRDATCPTACPGMRFFIGLTAPPGINHQPIKTPRSGGLGVLDNVYGDADFTASYNNHIGRPTGTYSGTIGGLLAAVGYCQVYLFVAIIGVDDLRCREDHWRLTAWATDT